MDIKTCNMFVFLDIEVYFKRGETLKGKNLLIKFETDLSCLELSFFERFLFTRFTVLQTKRRNIVNVGITSHISKKKQKKQCIVTPHCNRIDMTFLTRGHNIYFH